MQLLVDLFFSLVSVPFNMVTNLDTQSKWEEDVHIMGTQMMCYLIWQALRRSTTQFVIPQMCLFWDVDLVSNGLVFPCYMMWLACHLRIGIDTPHHLAKHYKSQN